MLRVMIVDDEPAHRYGLMRHVHWEALGYETPIQAEDGEEALFLEQSNKVDVLIADVCLPGIDGIELVKQMRRRNPRLYVLIISGFEEFEFARAAVEAGARAYLLKPLRIDEVEKWLKTFKEEISLAEELIRADISVKKKLNNSLRLARERFMESLINEDEYGQEIMSGKLELLDLPSSGIAYRVVVFSLDEYYVILAKDPQTASSLIYRLSKMIELALKDYGSILVKTAANRLMAFLLLNKGNDTADALQAKLDIIRKSLEDEEHISISIGISRKGEAYGQVSGLYREVVHAMDAMLKFEKGQILWVENALSESDPERFDSLRIYAKLSEYVRKLDEAKIIGLLSEVYGYFQRESSISFSFVHSFSLGIISELYKLSEAMGFQPPKPFIETCGFILCRTSVAELKETILRFILDYLRGLDEYQNNQKSQVVELAAQYLRNHLGEDITVKTLAGIVHLNPSYLSVLFKKEMGETISDYVNRLRIEKAKMLLQQGAKVVDIAKQIGYQNPSYFSNQFRKATGRTPADYRKFIVKQTLK